MPAMPWLGEAWQVERACTCVGKGAASTPSQTCVDPQWRCARCSARCVSGCKGGDRRHGEEKSPYMAGLLAVQTDSQCNSLGVLDVWCAADAT